MATSKRMAGNLARDLYVLEDESNPRGTQVDTVWPSTVLDQVFDNLSPTNKTLRQILEDLKQEIITGGRGNIVFPVTTVNGKTDDVVITKEDVGLGRVDNTRDVDKPLSIPQRTAVEEMLANYNFQVNLDDLYNHLHDTSNPHGITIEQLDLNDGLSQFVKGIVTTHNFSRDKNTHIDIRNSLSRLWTLVDGIEDDVEAKIEKIMGLLENHLNSQFAHDTLFDLKEDRANKTSSFNGTENTDNVHFPTTKAVSDFTRDRLEDFRKGLPQVENWIDDIQVVDSRNDLPTASVRYLRKAYFIRKGMKSFEEVAICRQYPNGGCHWDITTLGSYSKFNPDHFVDSGSGLCIKMSAVVDAIVSENGELDVTFMKVLKDYYNRDEIDAFKFVRSIHLVPGTVDGTIRLYINEDVGTMTEDCKVAGLKRLAYLEWVTEDELADQAVFGRHIISKAIEKRHLNDRIIDPAKLTCHWGYLLGNTKNADSEDAHEIPLRQLADDLRPLIGGWPDPSTPGGNPWSEMLDEAIMHPHRMDPEVEYPFTDGSIARRFVGEISCIPNMDIKTILSDKYKLGQYRMIEAGGSWQYQTDPDEWTMLGGSNITGHTFATIVQTQNGIQLESISIGNRINAQYDVWVKFVKEDDVLKFY